MPHCVAPENLRSSAGDATAEHDVVRVTHDRLPRCYAGLTFGEGDDVVAQGCRDGFAVGAVLRRHDRIGCWVFDPVRVAEHDVVAQQLVASPEGDGRGRRVDVDDV